MHPVSLGPLPPWDVERRRVDVSGLIVWARDTLRAAGVDAELDRLHEHIDAKRAAELAHHLTVASRCRLHRAALFAVLRAAMPGLDWTEVVVQSTSHFRILIPGDTRSPVPPHTDHGIGHPLDERNVWIALTDARGSAALRVQPGLCPPADAWGLAEDDDTLVAFETSVGGVLLFTPLHVHAARAPETQSRVSIDVRIAPHTAVLRHPTGYVAVEAR